MLRRTFYFTFVPLSHPFSFFRVLLLMPQSSFPLSLSLCVYVYVFSIVTFSFMVALIAYHFNKEKRFTYMPNMEIPLLSTYII